MTSRDSAQNQTGHGLALFDFFELLMFPQTDNTGNQGQTA
jgi:hypothetical protein